MHITWLGTAGFIIKTPESTICFDPFLTRGIGKSSPFKPKDFADVSAIFVGHGHFDHVYDIPDIVKNSDVHVFAPGLTGNLLKLRGVPSLRITTAGNKDILSKALKVRAFKSQHAKFDQELITSTLKRCGIGGCMHLIPKAVLYPQGLVQSYCFEHAGKKVLFVSSGGCTSDEIQEYRKLEIDIFLAPIHGPNELQEKIAGMTSIINPKIVIPHHFDNFYPPLSESVSIEPFQEELNLLGYKGDVIKLPLFGDASV